MSSTDTLPTLLNRLLSYAYHCGASTIHLDPARDALLVKHRTKGALQTIHRIPDEKGKALIAYLAARADSDPALASFAQRGRLKEVIGEVPRTVSLTLLPTTHGMRATLNFLTEIPNPHGAYVPSLDLKPGMTLICGPRGCGATTTLSHLAARYDPARKNIVFLEYLTENALPGASHIPRPRDPLASEQLLRRILRSDPDVIVIDSLDHPLMVQTALDAARAGHTILTWFAAPSAPALFSSAADERIPIKSWGDGLSLLVQQHRLPRVCTHCQDETPLTAAQHETLADLLPATLHDQIPTATPRGRGCRRCDHTGSSASLPLFGITPADASFKSNVRRNRIPPDITHPLIIDGLHQMKSGRVSHENLSRLARSLA